MIAPARAAEVQLHAAGSLRGALTEVAIAFEAADGSVPDDPHIAATLQRILARHGFTAPTAVARISCA